MKLTNAQDRLVKMLVDGYTTIRACQCLGIKRNTGNVHIAAAKLANGCRTLPQLTAKYGARYGIDDESPPTKADPNDSMHPWRESFKKHNPT